MMSGEDIPHPMLSVLAPVHSERLGLLRALQMDLSLTALDLAAVLAEAYGFPVLSVVRVDGGGSMFVGVKCHRDEGSWWYVAPHDPETPRDTNGNPWSAPRAARTSVVWLAPAHDVRSAAAAVTRTLRR